MKNKRIVILAVLLVLSVGNFTRLNGNENIRAIEFLSIFVIGAFSSLLIREVITLIKKKREISSK
jgi:hypothetical protein